MCVHYAYYISLYGTYVALCPARAHLSVLLNIGARAKGVGVHGAGKGHAVGPTNKKPPEIKF